MKFRRKTLVSSSVFLVLISCLMSPVAAFSEQFSPGALSLLLFSGDSYANTGAIYGQVKSTSGTNLGGVKISVSGSEVTESNGSAYFSYPGITPADRVVVTFSKDGYVSTTANVRIQSNLVTFIEPVMSPVGTSANYTGNELTLNNDDGSITIPASSLVDSSGNPFSGTASATFTAFDPTVEAERNAFPGDFEGRTSLGEDIPILSYGFFDITVTDADGNELQLANGATAPFSIPIPEDILASAPATMPLWYFNEANGRWEEEGTVTKEGTNYVGNVPHFSIWNNDVGYNRSYVTGRVICAGIPIQGARVTFKGISPRNCWDSGESSTPATGAFRVPVDAGSVVDYWLKKDTFESSPVRFTSAAANGVIDLGDIEFCPNLPSVVFTLTWGENPSDLDSHLWTPSGAHIYYSHKSDDGASLDYDDTTSYGPEHVAITTLNDGEYLYSVHWYSGTGTWGTSGGVVMMTIDGGRSYTLGAPSAGAPTRAGGSAANYWDLWKLTVENGQVTNVTTVDNLSDHISSSTANDISSHGATLPTKSAEYIEQHK